MKEYTDKQLLQMSKTELVEKYRLLEMGKADLLEKYRELESSIKEEQGSDEHIAVDNITAEINVELLAEQIAEALRKSNAHAMRKVGSF